MKTIFTKTALLSSALALSFAAGANADGVNRAVISDTIKAHVRDIVTGINTHDAALVTKHDAPNIVVIQSGQPNTVGAAADLADFKQGFAAAPTWRVSLVEETVDVPQSGEMAVYRSVYNQDSMHDKVPFTQKLNVIAGWSRHENAAWMMDWYAVSEMEKAHKK